jgi:hypothetical protein
MHTYEICKTALFDVGEPYDLHSVPSGKHVPSVNIKPSDVKLVG